MSNRPLREKIPAELVPTFCPAPFSSLQVNAFGNGGVCPKSAGTLKFPVGLSVEAQWKSETMERFREEFLSGEKPKECFRCWSEEDVNIKSLRQFYLDFDDNALRFDFDETLSRRYLQGPKSLVIQSTNYCNFSCRTCHAADSSGFNREGEFYNSEYGEKKNRYRNSGMRLKGAYNNQHFSEENIQSCVEVSGNLEKIEFFGGETLLNKSHENLLLKLIENGRAKEISLFYCTNGSTFPEYLVETWKEFKRIDISFSIDGGQNSFHYVRHPGNWSELMTVVEKFSALKETHEMDHVASITVSLLNIFDLEEIYSDVSENVASDVTLHLVFNPDYYSICHLPPKVKEVVLQRLKSSRYSQQFQGVINYIEQNTDDPEIFRKFIIWTVRKDRFRKQSFQDVFPEYYQNLREFFVQNSNEEDLYSVIADGVY